MFTKLILPLHPDKALFSIMQKKTDKGTSLVSKSLLIINSNSANRLFSTIKINYNVLNSGTKFASQYHTI